MLQASCRVSYFITTKNAELNITPIEERILNMSSLVMVAKCIQSHRESDFVFLSFGW